MTTIFKRVFVIGDSTITVTASREIDDSPEYSYLGEFTNFVSSPVTGCYHRDSGLMWDGSLWRNEKGQIQASPIAESYWRSRGYRFINIGDCQFTKKDKNWLTYAFQNAKRLDLLGREWNFFYITVTIEVEKSDGWYKEFAHEVVGGVEHDYTSESDEYVLATAKELLSEAWSEVRNRYYQDRPGRNRTA